MLLCQFVCNRIETTTPKRARKGALAECLASYPLDLQRAPVGDATHNAGVEGSSPSLSIIRTDQANLAPVSL
jgi:hypothetical protein